MEKTNRSAGLEIFGTNLVRFPACDSREPGFLDSVVRTLFEPTLPCCFHLFSYLFFNRGTRKILTSVRLRSFSVSSLHCFRFSMSHLIIFFILTYFCGRIFTKIQKKENNYRMRKTICSSDCTSSSACAARCVCIKRKRCHLSPYSARVVQKKFASETIQNIDRTLKGRENEALRTSGPA